MPTNGKLYRLPVTARRAARARSRRCGPRSPATCPTASASARSGRIYVAQRRPDRPARRCSRATGEELDRFPDAAASPATTARRSRSTPRAARPSSAPRCWSPTSPRSPATPIPPGDPRRRRRRARPGAVPARKRAGVPLTASLAAMSALAGLVDKGLMAPDWAEALAPVDDRIARMGRFLREELAAGRPYLPAGDHIFRAFQRPLADVRVLVVGQDPYPTPGPPDRAQLRGRRRTSGRSRASLANIYQELRTDLGVEPAAARRPDRVGRPGRDAAQPGADRAAGRAGVPPRPRLGGGHRVRDHGAGARAAGRCAAILWGRDAQSLKPMLGPIPWVESAHPSPLSAQPRLLRLPPVQPGQPAAGRAGRRSRWTGRCPME